MIMERNETFLKLFQCRVKSYGSMILMVHALSKTVATYLLLQLLLQVGSIVKKHGAMSASKKPKGDHI